MMSGDVNSKLTALLHTTLSACHTYSSGCEDAVAEQLSTSIQSLLKYVTAETGCLQEFHDDNRLAVDCLMSVLSITSQVTTEILPDILDLLILLAGSPEACRLLGSLGALETIAMFLEKGCQPVQTMKLMSKLTQHVRSTGHEMFMDSLIHHLINNILSNDVTLKYSLAVLVNISSNNLPVQMQVRSLDRCSSLRRAIRRLVSHDDTEVSITTIAAMTSSGMSEEFNKIVSNDRNLDQLLKLSFSILLTVRKSESFPYAVSVLVSLVSNRSVQQFLLNNSSQLETFMSKAVSLLTTCHPRHLSKLFELLLALAAVPGLRIILTKLMFAPVPSDSEEGEEQELLQHVFQMAKRPVIKDLTSSSLALNLLTYLYEALSLDPSLAGSTSHLHFQFLTECLKQSHLDDRRQAVRLASANKIQSSLSLLELLVSSEAFCSVMSEVEPSTVTDIIDYQLHNNPVCMSASLGSRQTPSSTEEGIATTDQTSVVGVEIVLRSMSILIEASERNDSVTSYLSQYIQLTSLLPFLAAGLSSCRSEVVQLSLKVVMKAGTLTSLPVTVLSNIMAGLNQRQASVPITNQKPPLTVPVTSTVASDRDNKENVIQGTPIGSPRFNEVIPSSQGSEVDIAEKLATLQVGGGDSHVSDIISVYEQKLRSQKTREMHLDDLVQAKSMALSQADRLIQQYKGRLAQVDAETMKLRSIVHESERRSESYREKMNEMLIERERIQNEMERLQQDSQKLEDTQRALASVKRELDTLTEIHTTLTNFTDNLKQQHRELESDYSQLKDLERKKSVSVSELEAKLNDLQKHKSKLEEQCKKFTKEKTTLSEQLENQKAECKKLEKTLKQKEEKLRVIFETLK